MGVLSKGTDFTNGDQVTDTSLDNLVDNATFTTSAVDEVSTDIGGSGSIIVKDGGITTGKLADSTSAATGVTSVKIATSAVTEAKIGTNAVTTAKILDDNVTTAKILNANVTKAKIENLTDYTVLGNVSGGAAAPAEVTILDEDTLVTDSATALATQQSIKAYVDTITIGVGQAWQSFGTPARTDGTSYQNTTGKPIMVAIHGRDDANPSAQVSSDGIAWITLGLFVNQSLGGAAFTDISFIVPNNHYYRTTAGIADRSWLELR